MLVESSETPYRIPWLDAPGGIPVAWITQGGVNMLTDPGFENGDLAVAWTLGTRGAASTAAPYAGAQSLAITSSTTVYAGVQSKNAMPVTAGVRYRLSARARLLSGATASGGASLRLRFGSDATTTQISGIVAPAPAGMNTNYIRVSGDWIAPAGTTHARFEILTVGALADGAVVLIDDAQMIEVPEGGIPAATVAQVSNAVERIPQAIRTAFAPMVQQNYSGGKYLTGALRIYMSDDLQFLRAQHLNEGGNNWGGLYTQPLVSGKPFPCSFAAQVHATGTLNTSILHEYGHHIDFTYHRLWSGGNSVLSLLNSPSTTPLSDLYTAAKPTIPTNLYGYTNSFEWFAELWTCQMLDASFVYRDITAGSMFLQLAGNDQTRANAIRKAFTDLLPMPPFTGY